MFIFPQTRYPRSTTEKLFRQINVIGLALNFGAWIVTFVNFTSRVDNTFHKYWSQSKVKLSVPLETILSDCVYQGVFTINGSPTDVSFSAASATFPAIVTSTVIVAIFIIHAALIGVDFLLKGLFALNIRALRIQGLYIRVNIVLLTIHMTLSAGTIAAIVTSQTLREFVQSYISYCAHRESTLSTLLLDSEYDVEVVFGLDFSLILAAVVINLLFFAMAAFHLCYYAFQMPFAKMQQAKHPWEVGLLCRPDKPLLMEYTALCSNKAEELDADVTAAPYIHYIPSDNPSSGLEAKHGVLKQNSRVAAPVSHWQQRPSQPFNNYHGNTAAYDFGGGGDDGLTQFQQPLEEEEVPDVAEGEEYDEELEHNAIGGEALRDEGEEGGAAPQDGAHRRRHKHRRKSKGAAEGQAPITSTVEKIEETKATEEKLRKHKSGKRHSRRDLRRDTPPPPPPPDHAPLGVPHE